MIEYLISSFITNIGLLGFLVYKLMLFPKKYNKVIIIDEKGGSTQIKIEYCKIVKDNELKVIGKKLTLKLQNEENEENTRYLDSKGKNIYIVRTTDGILYSYVKYEKTLLKGLSKEKRVFFADLVESNNKEWNNDNPLGKFFADNSTLIIMVLCLMGMSILLLKFSGEPSKQLIDTFGQAITTATNALTSATGALASNTTNVPII